MQHSISSEAYRLEDFQRILANRCELGISKEVEARIRAGAQFLHSGALDQSSLVYAVNTGFGSLCETRVDEEQTAELQTKQVLSHACGVGAPIPERVSRLMLLLKLITFRGGHTGVSLDVVERLIQFWNHDVIPVVPGKGSVGASGDLAPLAHMALPLIGRGQVHFEDEIRETPEVLEHLSWKPLRLKKKEGVALTNGVQFINAITVNSLLEIEELVRSADLIAAMSAQAFSTSSEFYDALYHETTFHPERKTVCSNLRKVLEGSNHHLLPTCNESKQDPYSFRCIPQVHGAVRQTIRHAGEILERECNGVSDNPLFFPDEGKVLCGGNLHGESTAFVADFLSIAVTKLSSIAERRSYQLLSGQRGLPDFLVENPGLESGYMVSQYTQAALVNENKVLSTPASVDTIPTCQLQEDVVSMGGTAANKLVQIVENCECILAIELLLAAQATDLNKALMPSETTRKIVRDFRESVPFLETDRFVGEDIEKSRAFLARSRKRWAENLS